MVIWRISLSRFDCFTSGGPNGPHLRPDYDRICLVVTLNALQLQVVGLKVLDLLLDSFRFFVQYSTWRPKL